MVSYDYLVFELASIRLGGQTRREGDFLFYFLFDPLCFTFILEHEEFLFQQTFLKLRELSAC